MTEIKELEAQVESLTTKDEAMYHIDEIKRAMQTIEQCNPGIQCDFVYAASNSHTKGPYRGHKGTFQLQKKSTGETKDIGSAKFMGRGFWNMNGTNRVTKAIISNRLN